MQGSRAKQRGFAGLVVVSETRTVQFGHLPHHRIRVARGGVHSTLTGRRFHRILFHLIKGGKDLESLLDMPPQLDHPEFVFAWGSDVVVQ